MTCTQAVEPFLFRQGTEGRAQATQKGRAQATYRGVELAPLLVALVGDGRNERRGGQGVHAEAHRSVEERLYTVHGTSAQTTIIEFPRFWADTLVSPELTALAILVSRTG